MDEIDNIRSIVKAELLKTFGVEILYAKDCQILSVSILQKTNRQISSSTLKRLFGIIHSPYNLSKYTLDTIAIYLNYPNWDALKNSITGSKPSFSDLDYWTLLKKRIQIVSSQSLISMKAKHGNQFSDFQAREFAINKFETFLNSPYLATAFIAPGGYGKTTIVAQLVELFFTGQHARYPNDIVCLVDGSILPNLVNLNLEVVRLKNIIEFEHRNSFSIYFRKHPEQVKGRFVLIIESLYQIYHQEEKLNNFIENLMDIVSAYEDVSWFKLLITCRPDNWKNFSNLILKNPHLESKWFDVHFGGSAIDSINVPLLSKSEIIYFLNKRHSAKKVEQFKFHYPEVTEIFNNPYLLQLFSTIQTPKGIYNDLELLDYFVSEKILTEPYLEEKSTIISAFFKISNYLKKSSSVNKADLPTSAEFSYAYRDLIFNNLLYEFTIRGSYLSVKTYVKFSSDILLEFFLANIWIQEKGFDLELFKLVYEFYENNPVMQTNILKYLIKIAFKENRTDILSDVFTIFECGDHPPDLPLGSQVNQEIINIVGIELRKNKKAREILIPLYAKSQLGQLLYFESFFDMDSLVLHSGDSIDHYLENKHTDEAMIYGHFLKFMQYFLAGDRTNCKKEYEFFQGFLLTECIDPALSGYYYGAQFIYQSVFEDMLDRNLLEEIYSKSYQYFKERTQSKTGIPFFEYIVLYSLNYGDCFSEIIRLSNLTFKRYKIDSSSYTWRHQLVLLIFARALLNSGNTKTALSLYKQVELKNVPVNYNCYVRLRSCLIQVEFLVFEKKMEEAKSVIEEIKTISKLIRHKYFYNKALMWEVQMH